MSGVCAVAGSFSSGVRRNLRILSPVVHKLAPGDRLPVGSFYREFSGGAVLFLSSYLEAAMEIEIARQSLSPDARRTCLRMKTGTASAPAQCAFAKIASAESAGTAGERTGTVAHGT